MQDNQDNSFMPKFFDSPYFVPEPDNWHLKPDAPEDVKREFDEYMRADEEARAKGIIIN